MPSLDTVSKVDMQEVRNAVDQASCELVNHYDVKVVTVTEKFVRQASGRKVSIRAQVSRVTTLFGTGTAH